jgi:hypothetical protein
MMPLSRGSSFLEPLSLLNTPTYPPGVYRFASHPRPGPILTTITDRGWYAGYINGQVVDDKQTFLVAAGQAFAFPKYYGRNWDAFEEMVNDLNWIAAAGYFVLYDYVYRFAATQPEAWQTALSILESACSNWQREGIPFYVLLRHNWRWNRQLPKLTAQGTEKDLGRKSNE